MNQTRMLAVGLVALCAFQRLAQNSFDFHVPDLAIAAFFLIGNAGLSAGVVGALLLTVCGLDLAAFALGEGAACMSSAYPLIVPAYLAMWSGGRLAREQGVAATVSSYAGACVLAFAFSSGGWYALSGRFAAPTLAGFLPRIAAYLPEYMLGHGSLGLAGIVFMLSLRNPEADASYVRS